MAPQLKEILKLGDSMDEKTAATYQLSNEQIQLLEEELIAYKADPKSGYNWEEAKQKIRKG